MSDQFTAYRNVIARVRFAVARLGDSPFFGDDQYDQAHELLAAATECTEALDAALARITAREAEIALLKTVLQRVTERLDARMFYGDADGLIAQARALYAEPKEPA